jgi:hypothetical protein
LLSMDQWICYLMVLYRRILNRSKRQAPNNHGIHAALD